MKKNVVCEMTMLALLFALQFGEREKRRKISNRPRCSARSSGVA